jgi:microcystin-dependent protein
MKIKIVTVDFEIPQRFKLLALRIGIPIAVMLGGGALAYANLPQFQDGATLTAAALNSSFSAVAPPGTILAFAGTTCPSGTIAADGSSRARAGTYANLFSAIGTTYGSSDTSSFSVPNAQGVFLRGAGSQIIAGSPHTGAYTGTQGTSQSDATARNGLTLKDPGHSHTFSYFAGAYNTGLAAAYVATGDNNSTTANQVSLYSIGSSPTGITLEAGDSETRPANIAVLYCIWY